MLEYYIVIFQFKVRSTLGKLGFSVSTIIMVWYAISGDTFGALPDILHKY